MWAQFTAKGELILLGSPDAVAVSSIDYLSPINYEKHLQERDLKAKSKAIH